MACSNCRFCSGTVVNFFKAFSVFELGCLGNRASLFFGWIVKIPYLENQDQLWDVYFQFQNFRQGKEPQIISQSATYLFIFSLLALHRNRRNNWHWLTLNVKLTRLCEPVIVTITLIVISSAIVANFWRPRADAVRMDVFPLNDDQDPPWIKIP